MLRKPRQQAVSRPNQLRTRRPHRTRTSVSGRIMRVFAGLDNTSAVLVAAGLLMGRATVLGVLWPFGPAYYSAVVRVMPRSAALVAISLIAGAITTRSLGRIVVTALYVLLLTSVLRSFERKKHNAQLVPVLAGAVNFVSTAVWSAVTQATPYAYLMAAVEAVATVGLCAAFMHAAPALADPARRPGQEEVGPLCIFIASLVAGVAEIRVGPLELRNTVGSLITMYMAFAGGATIGAAAGVSAGVVVALSRPLAPLMVATQALGGLVGGLFGTTGKIGTVVGFTLGGMALLLPQETSAHLTKAILEILIASALFLVIRLPERFFTLLSPARALQPKTRQKLEEALAVRLHEFARVLRELSKSYAQIAITVLPEKDLASHFARFLRPVCEQCSQCSRCWDGQLCRRHNALVEMAKLAESKQSLSVHDVPAEMRQSCPRVQEVVTAVTCIADLLKAERIWAARSAEMRGVLAAQIKGVSTVIDGMANEIRVSPMLTLPRKRQLDYEISIARRAKQGSIICGDSVLHKETRDGKLVLILSDGMGSGPSAALESKATVALLEQLLDNGFDPEIAVQTVNSFMGLKFPDDTFATVDLAIVDLITGDAEFTKRSAAPSFIKREAEVTVLTTSSLPIGILGQTEADKSHKVIRDGDVLVMVTDGAMQWVKASRKDEPFAHYLTRLKLQHADEISGRLLDKVLEAGKDNLGDDVTIAVVRFLPADPERVIAG